MNNPARIEYRLLAFLSVVMLMILFWPFLGHDDTATHYSDKLLRNSYFYGNFRNYRYAPASIGYFIFESGVKYYSIIYIWIILFSSSLIWTAYEYRRFSGIPRKYFPILLVAIAAHGYTGELYTFSMAFLVYGLAFAGAGLALWSLRRFPSPLSDILSGIGTLLAFISYQPIAFVLPFAAALKVMHAALRGEDFQPSFRMALRAILSFVVGAVLFLLMKHFIGPENGREVSFESIYGNIGPYLLLIPQLFTRGLGLYSPLHERVIYGVAVVIVLGWTIWLCVKRPGRESFLALSAAVAAILILPCPFILLSPIMWHPAREMVSSSFFLAGVVAILATRLPPRFERPALAAAIVAVAASMFHQVWVYSFLRGQDDRDALAVQMIVSDIRKTTKVTPQTKLAVKSTWRNFAHKPRGLSAFDTPWSNAAIFRVLTGNFVQAPVPKGACAEPVTDFWRIEKVGDVIVVCMK